MTANADPTLARSRLKPGAITWRTLDDRAIVLDLQSSAYIELNASATSILQALEAGANDSEAADLLYQHFEVEPELAAQDVATFLEQCRSKGWMDS
jgi:hypothetical protein